MFGSRKLSRAGAAFATASVLAAAIVAASATQANAADWVVRPEWVKAHEDFLASAPLQGRGSATRDEAIAAAYVASRFEAYGLKAAPGMTGYTQVGHIVRPHLKGSPKLTLSGGASLSSLTLIIGAGDLRAKFEIFGSSDATKIPAAAVVVATNPQADVRELMSVAQARDVKLLIVPETSETRRIHRALGGRTLIRPYLEGSPPSRSRTLVATLSANDLATLGRQPASELVLSAPLANEVVETTNAIGFLPGSDPAPECCSSRPISIISAWSTGRSCRAPTTMPPAPVQ